MGASFSSISFGQSKKKDASTESAAASTSKKVKRKYTKQSKTAADIVRRSRRVTKSNPPKVIFPTIPKAKTPSRKKFPLTPKTRAKVEASSKPILRKSPRVVKHKVEIPKVAKGVPKYTPNANYDTEELIFAWDRGVLYEAKVMNFERSSNTYYLHYLGYKKSHDKWVTAKDMMKVEPSSRRYFKETRGKLCQSTWT